MKTTKLPTIMPLDKDMDFPTAFFAVKAKGGQLPPNWLHDDLLQNEARYKEVKARRASYWSWLRSNGAYTGTFLAKPKANSPFPEGDFKDSEYPYTLPARYIPKQAIGKIGIGLVFEIQDLKDRDGVYTVIPGKIMVQTIPQQDGLSDYDPETRVPNGKEPKGSDYWDARYYWCWTSQTLRPLVRYDDWFGGGRRGIVAGRRPYMTRGVGVVEPQLKLKGNQANQPYMNETFKTKGSGTRTLKTPFTVKKGLEIEVNIRTL